MATTDLMIGIGAEYKGRGAFNKANKDVLGLGKGVKTLAKAYIGLAGAQKAFRYGQASLRAFVADDKAAQQLAKTVGNLGLAYEQTNVENFISGLEKTYHVADDLLRPAFAKLVQVTGSYTKSKELLTTALNASAGAGVDLSTTVQDLSQAYVGNLKGLKKYNLGLTNAELATMSFEQIQSKLNATFLGQGLLAASTYAGQMDALTIAANNAKETIGKGLVDALTSAAGKRGDIDGLVKDIETLAGAAADTARFFGTIFGFLGKIVSLTDKITPGYQAAQAQKNKALNAPYNPMSANTPGLSATAVKNAQARAKVDKDAAKRQKELAALLVKQTKAVKEQTALAKAKAVLDKASAVFNMDLIQNTAALQGKLTEDETLRLKLQQAILLGNSGAAGRLAQELLATQEAAMKLNYSNPLGNWSDAFKSAIDALKQLQNELAALGAQQMPFWWMGNTTDPTEPGYTDPSGIGVPPVDYGYTPDMPSFTYGAGSVPDMNINITMNPDAAKLFITDVVVGNSANGNQNSLTRVTTPWMI
jgi:hypothetical protein